MYSLARFSLLEMTECSAVLRQLGEQSRSLQEAASRAVNYLFDTLGDPETGQRDCVLVRCFKTISYSRLDAEHQQLVRERLGGITPFPDLRCFTLVSSSGAEPDWNRVERSHRYRVIPMVSADFVKQFPMFSQLLHQFGVSTEFDVRADGEWLVDLEEKTYNVFYVPDAVGSPYVPVQEGFVGKYGVKSVLCFGGMLPSRDLFAVILFSKTPVPRETAALCKSLALSLKTSLLAFDEASSPDHGANQQSGSESEPSASLRHQSRLAVAEQLLRVYEDAVRTQSAGIVQAQQALHDRAAALERSEQALNEQTRIVNSVLRSMGDGVVVTDATGQLVVANPAVESILGFSPGAIPPIDWVDRYEFFHGDTATPFQRDEWPLARALRGEKVDWLEVYMRASQGVPGRWVSINARPIRDDAGVLCGTVVVFHDITWLKRAQDALFESEYRFRSLVEGARDIIFTLSADTTMTSLNQAFETVTNWSRS